MTLIVLNKIVTKSSLFSLPIVKKNLISESTTIKEIKKILNHGIEQGLYQETIDFSDVLIGSGHTFGISGDDFLHTVLNIKIKCYFYLNRLDGLIELCQKYYTNSKHFLTRIASIEGISVAYQQKGQCGLAYKYLNDFKSLLDEKKEEEYKGKYKYQYNYMTNMAYLYHTIEDFDEAFQYYDQALAIAEKHLDDATLVTYKINIITIKFTSGRLTADQAIAQMDVVLTQPLLEKNQAYLELALNNKASFLIAKEKYYQAYTILHPFFSKNKNIKITYKGYVVHNYLSCLFLMERYSEFKQVFYQFISDLLNIIQTNHLIEMLEKRIFIAKMENDQSSVISYQEKLIDLQKKMIAENAASALYKAKVRREIKLKEKEISHLKEVQVLKEKLNKELSRKNKELENFASTAAHDIKAPLRNINSFSKLLKRRLQLDENNMQLFSFIEQATKRMQNLVEDLLMFAKSGSFKGKAQHIDLDDVIYIVKSNLQTTINQNKAKVVITSPLPQIYAHLSPMIQLFQNMIANSIKFTQKDIAPRIYIHYKQKDNYHQISIQDNGIGIAHEHLARIFQPFVCLNTSSEFEGSGLGLATCAKIVRLLNGHIDIESEIGKGSTFIIYLPTN